MNEATIALLTAMLDTAHQTAWASAANTEYVHGQADLIIDLFGLVPISYETITDAITGKMTTRQAVNDITWLSNNTR